MPVGSQEGIEKRNLTISQLPITERNGKGDADEWSKDANKPIEPSQTATSCSHLPHLRIIPPLCRSKWDLCWPAKVVDLECKINLRAYVNGLLFDRLMTLEDSEGVCNGPRASTQSFEQTFGPSLVSFDLCLRRGRRKCSSGSTQRTWYEGDVLATSLELLVEVERCWNVG